MNGQTHDVSDDARTLLRIISKRPRVSFTTADMLALQPNHPGPGAGHACVAMEEREVTSALGELSESGGWLGSFAPGRYTFRALTPDMPDDACNPDAPR